LGSRLHEGRVLWFIVALVLAFVIGSLLSIPDRQAGLGRWARSVTIACGMCVVAWVAGDAVGVSATGPWAHVLMSVVFASSAASIFHAYVSERPTLL
jgi:hypothetical protein